MRAIPKQPVFIEPPLIDVTRYFKVEEYRGGLDRVVRVDLPTFTFEEGTKVFDCGKQEVELKRLDVVLSVPYTFCELYPHVGEYIRRVALHELSRHVLAELEAIATVEVSTALEAWSHLGRCVLAAPPDVMARVMDPRLDMEYVNVPGGWPSVAWNPTLVNLVLDLHVESAPDPRSRRNDYNVRVRYAVLTSGGVVKVV